ncbi:MAG: 3-phosphoglycerate dehydrogenase, partial [Gammaproteobacteria bacterium]|nr:3-phosphoglycerate dehydrogenase [Gammaproteobacteria bacterium]
MFQIRTLNNISDKGLSKFDRAEYNLGDDIPAPEAILLRSHKLTVEESGDALLAVGRAGAGVNNIPVAELSDRGVVVFNTPGANANAVKELVMAGLLLSQRGIVQGIDYVNQLDSDQEKSALNAQVEAAKKQFKGSELNGRTLGIVGLGAIGSMVADMALGSMVADMALGLGMRVLGYDPALSVEAAWRLSSQVQRMENMAALLAKSDLVSLHVPALPETEGLINEEQLALMQPGAVLLNFARGELVVPSAIRQAIEAGQLSQYISDFPTPELLGINGVIATPHLGASTDEAEENCAMMVADQVIDFLANGNIKNSVNFPAVNLERSQTGCRIAIVNRNVPRLLGSVLSILADRNINVIDMINKSRDELAYNLIDIEANPEEEL